MQLDPRLRLLRLRGRRGSVPLLLGRVGRLPVVLLLLRRAEAVVRRLSVRLLRLFFAAGSRRRPGTARLRDTQRNAHPRQPQRLGLLIRRQQQQLRRLCLDRHPERPPRLERAAAAEREVADATEEIAKGLPPSKEEAEALAQRGVS